MSMGAIAMATLIACGALTLVDGVGPVLALGLLASTAFLFGNWYRTSTTPARFETEPVVADSETFEGFTLYWTAEGAASHATTVAHQVPAGVSR
jgi:hypothetical protein